MAQVSAGGLKRSAISFRRQGSSGLVWDDLFLTGEITQPKDRSKSTKPRFYSQEFNQPNKPQHGHQRQRSRFYDDVNVNNPTINIKPIKTARSNQDEIDEPGSPRVKGCGCCAALRRTPRSGRTEY
uniref:MAPK kinase substrate protein n=1 Tax=Chenopodium quinoa TaxID=63459 RepID=A0A803LEE7_CHEQI